MPDDTGAARPRSSTLPAEPEVSDGAGSSRSWWQLPLDLLRGFLIGLAELVPGVSGGTVALVTGVYEQLLDSVHHVSSAARRAVTGPDRWRAVRAELRRAEWRLVVPLAAGMAVAMLTVAGTLESFVADSPEAARGLFLGLVVASVVVPLRMLPPARRMVGLDVTLVLGVAVGASWAVGRVADASLSAGPDVPLPLVFAVAAVAVCALVLPGVSGSFLLLVVGLYSVTLGAIDERDLAYLTVFGLGALVGLGTVAPVLRHLLERHRRTTLLVMAGLLLGSLRALWPWQSAPDGAAGEAQAPGAVLAPYDPVLGPVLLALLGAAVVLVLVVVEARRGRVGGGA